MTHTRSRHPSFDIEPTLSPGRTHTMRRSDMHFLPPLLWAVVTSILLLATPAAARGQSATPRTKSRTWVDPQIATLMLVDDLGRTDARAVVIRRPGDLPNNIILVTHTTTAANLANAASALIHSRRSRGDAVDREIGALIGATPVGSPPAGAKKGTGSPAEARRSTGPSVALAAS